MSLRFRTCSPVVALAAATWVGCSAGTTGPVGYVHHQVPVKIIPAAEAERMGLQPESIAIPFGRGADGTRLVADILAKAHQTGAHYASNIEIHLVSERDGVTLDCTTHVLPEVEHTLRLETHYVPGTTRSRYRMKPVTRTVTEYQYRCRTVMRSESRTETYYAYEYDYASKRSRSVPKTRYVSKMVPKQECGSKPVTRTVTRMENQFELEYVPARTEYFTRHYSDWKLVTSEQLCTPVAAGTPSDVRALTYRAIERAPQAD